MYGKTFEELPGRLEEFLDEFRKEDPDELDHAFKAVRGTCTEFPTPAHVRSQLKRAPDRLQHERLLAAATDILERDAKPADWEPGLTAEQAKEALAKIQKGVQ